VRTRLLIALVLLVGEPLAHGDVRFVSSSGFIVVNQVTTSAKPEAAWRALVGDVARWWPADHTYSGNSANLSIEPRAGGCFCENDASRSVEHMRIAYVEAPKLLRMVGGLGPLQGMGMYGALDWSIEPEGEGARITLTYKVGGINPEGFAELAPIVDRVQAQQLGGLAEFLSAAAR